MNCKKCGALIESGNNFCIKCGEPVSDTAAVAVDLVQVKDDNEMISTPNLGKIQTDDGQTMEVLEEKDTNVDTKPSTEVKENLVNINDQRRIGEPVATPINKNTVSNNKKTSNNVLLVVLIIVILLFVLVVGGVFFLPKLGVFHNDPVVTVQTTTVSYNGYNLDIPVDYQVEITPKNELSIVNGNDWYASIVFSELSYDLVKQKKTALDNVITKMGASINQNTTVKKINNREYLYGLGDSGIVYMGVALSKVSASKTIFILVYTGSYDNVKALQEIDAVIKTMKYTGTTNSIKAKDLAEPDLSLLEQ